MLNTIIAKMAFPEWVNEYPRYKRLKILDRWLDGCFYDHLDVDFVKEMDESDQYIPISCRKPSVQYNIPNQVATKTASKLFAGRQQPKLVSEDKALIEGADVLLREGFWDRRILYAAKAGSVGAVAMTFRFINDARGTPRLCIYTHRSSDCRPTFDALGELLKLRLEYVVSGTTLLSQGITKDCQGDAIRYEKKYWYVCDYTVDEIIEFVPVPQELYNPVDPDKQVLLHKDDKRSSTHNFGFVPGHWFVNEGAPGDYDGQCIFEPALSICAVIDYTMSQNTRGLWYNLAPQLVIKGELIGYSDLEGGGKITRGPAHALQFRASQRDAAGQSRDGGDAKLLETTGAAFQQGRENIEQLRKFAFQLCRLSLKDPDRMRTAAMPARGMELLDEETMELIQELRTYWGPQGMLPFVRKLLHAAQIAKHPAVGKVSDNEVEALSLSWPRPYIPSTRELFELAQAARLFIGAPETPGKPAGPDGAGGTAAIPAEEPLADVEDLRLIVAEALDIQENEDAGLKTQQTPKG